MEKYYKEDLLTITNNINNLSSLSENEIVEMGDKLTNVLIAYHKYIKPIYEGHLQFNETYVKKTIDRMKNFKSFSKHEKESFLLDFRSDLRIDLSQLITLFSKISENL